MAAGEQGTNLFYHIGVERHSTFSVVFGLFRAILLVLSAGPSVPALLVQ